MTGLTALLTGSFFGSALATWLVVPLVIKLAKAQGWLDHPGGRRIHTRAIPRPGGLAIFFGLLVGSSFYGLLKGWGHLFEQLAEHPELSGFFAPCALVFLVGLLDDIRGLSPFSRLLLEALAATAVPAAE